MGSAYNYDPDWDCYPITTRPVGENSLREVDHEKNWIVKLFTDTEERLVLASRSRTYHNKYTREFKFSVPYVYALDSSVNEAADASEFSTYGELLEEFSFVDTQIVYRDLRTDIIILRKWEGNLSFSGNSDHALGELLIDDGLGLQSHTTNDTVGINANHTIILTTTERLIIKTPNKDVELCSKTTETPVELNLGSTDYSGYCQGIAYGCLVWGTYGVVDESKPHPDKDNYTKLYEENTGETPVEYYPPWLQISHFQTYDEEDAIRFSELFDTNTERKTLQFNLVIQTDPFPQCGIAVDQFGNTLISVLKDVEDEENPVYNILLSSSGEETNISELINKSNINLVLYPLAAV